MARVKRVTKRAPVRTSGARPGGSNMLRIVGGEWRGRRLTFPDALGLRPTGDRLRETLFNWLQFDLPGRRCLDLFAGSGALGFEAASRGAGEMVMVEANPKVAKVLESNRQLLQAEAVKLFNRRAQAYLHSPPEPFDIVFLDPPFAEDFLAEIFALLQQGWLADGALIYIEQPLHTELVWPDGWQLRKEKATGQVQVWLLEVG